MNYHIILAGGWRIEAERDNFELQLQEPARLRWHCMYEAPTVALCEAAYVSYCEGETPPPWEELAYADAESRGFRG